MQSKNQLVIYPLDPQYQVQNAGNLGRTLTSIEFVVDDASTRNGLNNYLPGDRFMKYLVFLGCSPSIEDNQTIASDQDPGNYNNYHVEIDCTANEPVVVYGPRLRAPVCPACNQQDKQALVSDGICMNTGLAQWECSMCSAKTPIQDINWRHRLAIATHFITVFGVFEGEVVPADELLRIIADKTGVEWSYCYC